MDGIATAPTALARRLGQARFISRVLSWHQVVPHLSGQQRMCSCGAPVTSCGYFRAASELLDQPSPDKEL